VTAGAVVDAAGGRGRDPLVVGGIDVVGVGVVAAG